MSDKKPLVTITSDPSQVKEAQQKEAYQREREIEDVRVIMATLEGRRFVWRYLTLCGVFRLSFNHSGSITAFNEGARNIGITLMNDVHALEPEKYLTMMNESKGDL